MRILVTNDDGIHAPGLVVAEAIAKEIAGADGEVWVVAPSSERSGVGHCISYTSPALIEKRGAQRYAVDGYPADCILAGIYDVLEGARPDLILSGVNRGNNSAENTLYSGTIGATMEGALQGVPSIALSQFYGPDNNALDDPFEAALKTGAATVRAILDAGDWGTGAYGIFYNVNFPPVPASAVKGVKVVAQGRRDRVNFRADPHTAPSGRRFLYIGGGAQSVDSGPDTDASVNVAGYTSVTPMRCDLTAHDRLDALAAKIG